MKTKCGDKVTLALHNPLWGTQGVICGTVHTPLGDAYALWHSNGTFSAEFHEHDLVKFKALDHRTYTWDQFLEANK